MVKDLQYRLDVNTLHRDTEAARARAQRHRPGAAAHDPAAVRRRLPAQPRHRPLHPRSTRRPTPPSAPGCSRRPAEVARNRLANILLVAAIVARGAEPAAGRGRRRAGARRPAGRHRAVLGDGRPAHDAAGPLLRRLRDRSHPAWRGRIGLETAVALSLVLLAAGIALRLAVADRRAVRRQPADRCRDRARQRADAGLREAGVRPPRHGDGLLLGLAEHRRGGRCGPDHPHRPRAGRGLALGARHLARARPPRAGALAAGGGDRARAPDERADARGPGLLVAAAPAAGPAGHRLSGAAERAVLLDRRLAADPARRRRRPGEPGWPASRAGQRGRRSRGAAAHRRRPAGCAPSAR